MMNLSWAKIKTIQNMQQGSAHSTTSNINLNSLIEWATSDRPPNVIDGFSSWICLAASIKLSHKLQKKC